MPVALVTGAATGIGHFTAMASARAGHIAFAGIRDPQGRNIGCDPSVTTTRSVPDRGPRPGPRRRGRGRRPAGDVRRDVLDAAAMLLFDHGMPALSYERVAAEAAVSKTTLYRWWPSIGALAAEAYFDRVENDLEFPDTGDIADDVRTQLRAFVTLLTTGAAGRVIAELIGAAQSDPALQASFSNSYSRPRRALAVDAFRRAQQRGQLRADVDPDLLVDQLWGACYHRLLIPDRPLDVNFADALVANAIRGAR